MTQKHHSHRFTRTEEAITVLFCLIDDAYANLNPRGRRYESLKRLSDSEVITLALFQQLRGVESERSFLRDAERFFSHLFPGVVELALGPVSQAGRPVGGFRRRRVGEVGFVQRLRDQAAPVVRYQPGAPLLRAYRRQCRRGTLDQRVARRSETRGGPC